MLAPSSFARMLHKAPVCQIPVRIPAGSRQIRTAAGPGRKGSANGLRPQMQALPFSSAAAAGRALARNRPCPNAVPAREMLLPFLAPSTCLAPCFEAETRPCSCGTSGQPLSAGRLVCLARLSDSLPAHLAARPRSGEHQGSRKTARRARPASLACARSSDLVQGGAQDLLPAVRHAQGSSSQTSRGEAQEPDPGASARPAPAAFKKKP